MHGRKKEESQQGQQLGEHALEAGYLEEHEAVVEVGVEVVDAGLHAEGVHPVAVHLLLPRLLDQLHVLLGRLQRRVVVEHVRHERQVELLVAPAPITDQYYCCSLEFETKVKG